MSFKDLLKAELTFVYADIIRRKSVLFMYVVFPYVLTLFIVLIGSSIGSYQVFKNKLGVDPIPFFITASYLMMSVMTVSDDILWRPIHDRMVGTLPYILLTHIPKLMYFTVIPIPRLLLVVGLGAVTLPPIYLMYFGFGVNSLMLVSEVISAALLASILFITFSILLTGLMYGLGGESWRILNIVRPLLLIFLGIYYPRFLMPLTLRVISSALPPSYIIELIYRAVIRINTAYSYVLQVIGIAIAIALTYAPLGSRAIRLWEVRKVGKGVEL